MPCAYCRTVNTVCLWGPMEEKRWKRPLLFVLSLLGSAGFGALLWLTWVKSAGFLLLALATLLVAASILGLLVSLRGCNACVARLFGA